MKDQVNSDRSISNDSDISVNREECNLENRDVEMTVECTSGLPKDTLSDGSKYTKVIFGFLG